MDAFAQKTITEAPKRADTREAVAVWAQVSEAGIGGAALQLATMHGLLVQAKRWISEDRFFRALSYCIALPGPETQQLSIYIGWLVHRMMGGGGRHRPHARRSRGMKAAGPPSRPLLKPAIDKAAEPAILPRSRGVADAAADQRQGRDRV